MYTIVINKAHLQVGTQALALATTSQSDDVAVEAQYLFRVRDQHLEMLGTDTKMVAQVTLSEAQWEGEPETFSVPGWRLHKWLELVDGAITLQYDAGKLRLKAEGQRRWHNLPAMAVTTEYPFWDSILAGARPQPAVSASSLREGLAFARLFISDEDTKYPHVTMASAKNGRMVATDLKAAISIRYPEAPELGLWVYRKLLGPVGSFLGLKTASGADPTVVILESGQGASGMFFLQRSDGVMLGYQKHPKTPSPIPDLPPASAQHYVEVETSALLSALSTLEVLAPKDEEHLTFKIADGALVVSMPGAGRSSTNEEEVAMSDSNLSELPQVFQTPIAALSSLRKILGYFSSTKKIRIQFGLMVAQDRASPYVQVYQERGLAYQAILLYPRGKK